MEYRILEIIESRFYESKPKAHPPPFYMDKIQPEDESSHVILFF
ncbi:hypothetical protein [Helicobacter saguini]|nr:hypothetical protein [Helicobacter saguini]